MTTNSFEPNRRPSLRLKEYDYSLPGAYFITICTQNRATLFADVFGGQSRGIAPTPATFILNEVGRMVYATWQEIPAFYPGIEIDAAVVMPNHFHAIVVISDRVRRGGLPCPPVSSSPPSDTLRLPGVVQRFKSLTTKRYRDARKGENSLSFVGPLWQRNYYDRIIRNETELNAVRQYILDNPANWLTDPENRTHPS